MKTYTPEEVLSNLRKQVADAEKLVEEAKERKRKEFKRKFEFTLFVIKQKSWGWDKIRDETIVIICLSGKVLNKEEGKALGAHADDGSMCYLYNTVTGKIICSSGGGTHYLGTGNGFEEDENKYAALEKFLRENPNGGDVTHLIEKS